MLITNKCYPKVTYLWVIFCMNDTESLSSTQIEMLKAIANGEQHFSSQAVKQIYNLGNPNTIVKNKKTLQNKDIIEKEKENFVFVDPIYSLWFKEEYC